MLNKVYGSDLLMIFELYCIMVSAFVNFHEHPISNGRKIKLTLKLEENKSLPFLFATTSVMNNLVKSIGQFTGNDSVQAIILLCTLAVLNFIIKPRFNVSVVSP